MRPILGQISITIPPALHKELLAYSWTHRPMALLVTYAVRQLLEERKTARPAYEPPTDTVRKVTIWLESESLIAAREAAEADGTSYSAFFRAAFTTFLGTLQAKNEPKFPDTSRYQRRRPSRK